MGRFCACGERFFGPCRRCGRADWVVLHKRCFFDCHPSVRAERFGAMRASLVDSGPGDFWWDLASEEGMRAHFDALHGLDECASGSRFRRASGPSSRKLRRVDREQLRESRREAVLAEYERLREARALARARPYVYLHYLAGRVVYVGRGKGARAYSPRSYKPDRVTKRYCRTLADSLVLEAMFIRKHQPRFNKVGVTL